MAVTGRIVALHRMMKFDRILVDESGIGGGVLDRLNEQGIEATGFVAGAKCSSEEIAKNCLNLKAEVFMKAKKLFEEDRLKILARPELLRDLRQMKREYQSNGKVKIVDPAKSPDFADSMAIGLHEPNSGTFIILDTTPDSKDKAWGPRNP
jgi:hypothetical protein